MPVRQKMGCHYLKRISGFECAWAVQNVFSIRLLIRTKALNDITQQKTVLHSLVSLIRDQYRGSDQGPIDVFESPLASQHPPIPSPLAMHLSLLQEPTSGRLTPPSSLQPQRWLQIKIDTFRLDRILYRCISNTLPEHWVKACPKPFVWAFLCATCISI